MKKVKIKQLFTVERYIYSIPIWCYTASISDVDDFSALANEILTIPSTMVANNFVCHNITVTDDMIVEGSETFIITVETSNPNNVIMGLNTAIVTIIDNDGKYNHS